MQVFILFHSEETSSMGREYLEGMRVAGRRQNAPEEAAGRGWGGRHLGCSAWPTDVAICRPTLLRMRQSWSSVWNLKDVSSPCKVSFLPYRHTNWTHETPHTSINNQWTLCMLFTNRLIFVSFECSVFVSLKISGEVHQNQLQVIFAVSSPGNISPPFRLSSGILQTPVSCSSTHSISPKPTG